MACLLVLAVAAAVLTAPPGKQLAHAARTTTTSAESFWREALPGAPMPDSIRELLRHPRAEANAPDADMVNVHGDDPPPMNFNYDDYRASPSAKALEHVGGARNAATDNDGDRARAPSSPAVFFLEDAVRVGGSLPFQRAAPPAARLPLELYTVRGVRAVEGSNFVVCRREAGSEDGDDVYGCRGVRLVRAYVVDVAGERGDAVTAVVVCHTDTSNLEHAAFRLLDVKPGDVAVCYVVPDAQMLPAKSEKDASSA